MRNKFYVLIFLTNWPPDKGIVVNLYFCFEFEKLKNTDSLHRILWIAATGGWYLFIVLA
jgi:hypothetical protein